MPRVVIPSEHEYVDKRLRPVLEKLKADRALLDDFLAFATKRGGDITLLLPRLQSAWWGSRTTRYVHFFVLVLAEFGFSRGLIKMEPEKRRRTKAH